MRRHALYFLPLLATFACRTGPDDDNKGGAGGSGGDGGIDTAGLTTDADGDGYDAGEDCDDSDASVNPGAEEACDDVDNDCDGAIDEGE